MRPEKIEAIAVDSFQNGRRKILYTTHGGTVDVQTRAGLQEVGYRAGSVLLCNGRDEVIVGPVDPQGALDLAERVMEGDQRVITDSQTLLALACAVIAYEALPEPDEPAPERCEAAMEAAHG